MKILERLVRERIHEKVVAETSGINITDLVANIYGEHDRPTTKLHNLVYKQILPKPTADNYHRLTFGVIQAYISLTGDLTLLTILGEHYGAQVIKSENPFTGDTQKAKDALLYLTAFVGAAANVIHKIEEDELTPNDERKINTAMQNIVAIAANIGNADKIMLSIQKEEGE